MSDPFFITGPALISFSGGRTSADMLRRIILAHGGQLPDDVVVAFANTGKERPDTLRFVHECETRWGVRVYWIEWAEDGEGFIEVGFNSADRNGETFDALINKKQALPNGTARWCTQFLKVEPLFALMRTLGYGEPGDYLEVIGLRHDEGHRILKGFAGAEKSGRRLCYPMGNARLTKRDVQAAWWGEGRRYETSVQPLGFDLKLPPLWGNCDLCFAMGAGIRRERIRQRPEVAEWWQAEEEKVGATFAMRESVADLVRDAATHKATPDLFDGLDDAECGTWCGDEAA